MALILPFLFLIHVLLLHTGIDEKEVFGVGSTPGNIALNNIT